MVRLCVDKMLDSERMSRVQKSQGSNRNSAHSTFVFPVPTALPPIPSNSSPSFTTLGARNCQRVKLKLFITSTVNSNKIIL